MHDDHTDRERITIERCLCKDQRKRPRCVVAAEIVVEPELSDVDARVDRCNSFPPGPQVGGIEDAEHPQVVDDDRCGAPGTKIMTNGHRVDRSGGQRSVVPTQ